MRAGEHLKFRRAMIFAASYAHTLVNIDDEYYRQAPLICLLLRRARVARSPCHFTTL